VTSIELFTVAELWLTSVLFDHPAVSATIKTPFGLSLSPAIPPKAPTGQREMPVFDPNKTASFSALFPPPKIGNAAAAAPAVAAPAGGALTSMDIDTSAVSAAPLPPPDVAAGVSSAGNALEWLDQMQAMMSNQDTSLWRSAPTSTDR